MEENAMSEIRALAATAAANHAEVGAAVAEERAAEAAVLAAAIDAARPALRALATRLKRRHLVTGNATDKQRSVIEYHDARGLHLAGDDAPQRDQPRDNRGAYEGCGLYLLADGSLAERTWSGSWSLWQGASDEDESELRPVTAREAMDDWKLEECLASLRNALQRHVAGKAPERARAARARAERLAALLTLSR